MRLRFEMEDSPKTLNDPQKEDVLKHFVMLMKDRKLICRTQCVDPPSEVPSEWEISRTVRRKKLESLSGLRCFSMFPAARSSHEENEWKKFVVFLRMNDMVAVVELELYKCFILPPDEGSDSSHLIVALAYRQEKSNSEKQDKCFLNHKFHAHESREENCPKPVPIAVQRGPLVKNYVQADPSYLKTLGHAHSGWIFGAIAELIDNSRDAKATKLDIFVETIYSKNVGKDIPMLSVIDDGCGMTHQEIVKMVCFGHKQPDEEDPHHIGRFGIGFKTGAMRIGRDALVLTQTANSRSIAFLSQSLNEENDNLEIPIVSYHRRGQFMEVDGNIQSEALANCNLEVIKEFSPFNEYLIGQKGGLFQENGTGTQIYIWNLDEWGSGCCLEWKDGKIGGSSFHQGDIFIRSRRIRSRPGQISQKVPLDYSLRAYLEVIFLDPRMKIYVQGSLVKSRPLAKSLSKTAVENGHVMGKHVQLTIGHCQMEWEMANCGMFLYWHGRLIEAYKRVGGMIHNADMGRGVIGVIDVTSLMNDGNGRVWVHNNKQGFQDSERYAQLEEWLGIKADEYWDKKFDTLQLKKGNALYKPDNEWVQCDKCRKWRILSSRFDSRNLPQEWFCYMAPFKGLCETPEEETESGVITVSAKRSKLSLGQRKEVGEHVNKTSTPEGNGDDNAEQPVEDVRASVLKRLRRRGPSSRVCKTSS